MVGPLQSHFHRLDSHGWLGCAVISANYAHHNHDHNHRAAYFHVLSDTLTPLLAIVALIVTKYIGLVWIDPLMGIVGAILVSRWSLELLHTTSAALLDKQGPA